MNQWKNYFCKLLNVEIKTKERESTPPPIKFRNAALDEVLTMKEIEEAIKSTKTGKHADTRYV